MEAKTMAQMDAIRKFMELKETRQKKVKKIARRNRAGDSSSGNGGGGAVNFNDDDREDGGAGSKKLTRSRSASNAPTVAGRHLLSTHAINMPP